MKYAQILTFTAALLLTAAASAQNPEDCPLHAQHTKLEQASSSAGGASLATPKALTPEQVKGLLAGEGLGTAKAAEMNHYPGPKHVLQMAEQIHLSEEQLAATQAIFDRMHEKAVALGGQIVEHEQQLDRAFAATSITSSELQRLVSEIAALQGELRRVHLSAHLDERQVLRPEQIAAYDGLRDKPLHDH